jgi:hypothetical protein
LFIRRQHGLDGFYDNIRESLQCLLDLSTFFSEQKLLHKARNGLAINFYHPVTFNVLQSFTLGIYRHMLQKYESDHHILETPRMSIKHLGSNNVEYFFSIVKRQGDHSHSKMYYGVKFAMNSQFCRFRSSLYNIKNSNAGIIRSRPHMDGNGGVRTKKARRAITNRASIGNMSLIQSMIIIEG